MIYFNALNLIRNLGTLLQFLYEKLLYEVAQRTPLERHLPAMGAALKFHCILANLLSIKLA